MLGTTAGRFVFIAHCEYVVQSCDSCEQQWCTKFALCGDVLFVGSGDGKLKRLKGYETKWALEMEVPLNGSITSISASSEF